LITLALYNKNRNLVVSVFYYLMHFNILNIENYYRMFLDYTLANTNNLDIMKTPPFKQMSKVKFFRVKE